MQDEIVAVRAGALAPGARPAVWRPEMLPIAVVDQGVEIVRRGKDDVAALAAVTAVGAAELDEFLAAKARGPAPAVTTLQIDFALVEKLHLPGSTRPLPPRSHFPDGRENRLPVSEKRPSKVENMLYISDMGPILPSLPAAEFDTVKREPAADWQRNYSAASAEGCNVGGTTEI